MHSQIIIAPAIALAPVTITADAVALKDDALALSALIGRVTNAAENEEAAKAQARIKSVFKLFEDSRVKMKEPALEYGRSVDRAVAPHKDELDRENGRVAALVSEFKILERRRVAEEEELQRKELARIEAEKQAEFRRIADEQARVEREAREAVAAAAKLIADATNAKQRESAEAARLESERLQKEATIKAAESAKQTARVESLAQASAYIESRPVLGTKARGQSEKEDWEIEVVNPYELARYFPECVTITPLVGKIKAALNEGRNVLGVRAKKILVTNQRADKNKIIDV